jgi:hypothetical protein
MNEILYPPKRRDGSVRSLLRDLTWRYASKLGLHGLYTWEIEDHWRLVERRAMPLPKLRSGLAGATLVQLSDLHFSPLMREAHVRIYMDLVNGLEPDFIAITGDFITASTRYYARRVGAVLSELRPRIASLAVLGNHDWGLWKPGSFKGSAALADYLTEQLEQAGVNVLRNGAHSFRRNGAVLHFVGLGELWSQEYHPDRAFAAVPDSQPTIALCHNPDAAPDLAAFGADYVLSGHTHGKILSSATINNLFFPVEHKHFAAGEYSLGLGRRLYVNRGIGHSWRPRRDHRPEVSAFTLTESQPHGKLRPTP